MEGHLDTITQFLRDLPASAGVYAGTEAHGWGALIRLTDVPAFVALLGWIVAIMLWRAVPRPRRQPAWSWLPGAAMAGTIVPALIDCAAGAAAISGVPNSWWDALLGAAFLGSAATIAYTTLATRGRASLAAALIFACLAIGATVWRIDHAPSGGWILAGVTLATGLHAGLAPGSTWSSRLALAIWALGPMLSSVGPLAEHLGLLQRSHSHSAMTLLTASVQAAGAWVAVGAFSRDILASSGPIRRRQLREAARGPVRIALAILATGMGFAIALGENIQRRRNNIKFTTLREVALRLDVAALERALGRDYRITQIRLDRRDRRVAVPVAATTLAPRPVATALQHILDDAFKNSSVTDLRFVTLREGWVVAVASSATRWRQSGGPALAGAVPLEPIGPSDLEEWASRTPAARWRTFDHATYQTSRIPVLGRNRRMLGWIESTDTVGTHHVGPNLVRTSPFVGTLVMVSLVIFLAVERRRAEERERVLRTAAVEEAASRAKSAFLLRLNRDLHPPLAALAGHAMRLQVRATTGAARRHLDAIRQQSAHLLHIADDLLDLGAIESGSFSWKPHAADVATLLHETIEPFDARAGAKGLTLSCEITSDVPDNIAIDATRFRQVATNLIGNAIKFTERGAVRVTLQIRTCADRTTMLELAVMDTGPGIAPADRVRLFEPFSRLAPTARKTGTGLGLALSAAICRRAGGALAVESDGRSGSCFRATFSIGGHAFPPQP